MTVTMTPEQIKKLDDTSDKVDKIYDLLVGNKELKQQGMIDELDEIKAFKQQIMKLKWYSLGALGFGALIIGFVKLLKELFFS